MQMIIAPPKVFLDTQIISDAECGKITRTEWETASRYLKHATRYCISPLTVGELLSGLVNGAAQHFDQHKRRLQLLLSPNDKADVFDPDFVRMGHPFSCSSI